MHTIKTKYFLNFTISKKYHLIVFQRRSNWRGSSDMGFDILMKEFALYNIIYHFQWYYFFNWRTFEKWISTYRIWDLQNALINSDVFYINRLVNSNNRKNKQYSYLKLFCAHCAVNQMLSIGQPYQNTDYWPVGKSLKSICISILLNFFSQWIQKYVS